MKIVTPLIVFITTFCLIFIGCNSTINEETLLPQSTKQISSQPSPEQYQISIVIHPPGAGVVLTEPPEDFIDAGTEVTFISIPENEFSLDHWRIDGQLSANITPLILNSNTVIEAYFLPDVDKILPPVVQDYIDKTNEIVLVDVRPFKDYQKDHIPGAISIPSDEIKSRWNEIPPDKITFVYASCMK